MSRTNPNILLGITGGIAAYKSAELCRLLMKQGHRVKVVMTEGAQAFVSPLTFQALSGEPVRTDLLDADAEQGMGHIELARWADAIIIAPATADFIARYAAGMANDLLTTVLLATTAPVYIAPAMNQAMWSNPLVQDNIEALNSVLDQISWLGPDAGEQACGDTGYGRMLEPLAIVDAFNASERKTSELENIKVLITAGPTREAIDPVRYLSNHSSGKMGYAMAKAFRDVGCQVTLISGPVNLPTPEGVSRMDISSALEMFHAVQEQAKQGCDIFVASAAVADYRLADVSANKLKKTGETLSIELIENPDILSWVGNSLEPKPYVVGFAAETNDVLEYAEGKRQRKAADMIVANDVSQKDIGFNSDFNAVTLVTSGENKVIERQSKDQIATQIVAAVTEAFRGNS